MSEEYTYAKKQLIESLGKMEDQQIKQQFMHLITYTDTYFENTNSKLKHLEAQLKELHTEMLHNSQCTDELDIRIDNITNRKNKCILL